MDVDEEDFVFYGTPIEREEELTSRKKKAVAEASGQLRTLPSWKQEVRDEEGRRRFHGAFTGGYSAGYYNTVGSKEGWTPQTFTSSRKNRAEVKQQSILNFLDEDEKEELESRSLGMSSKFDTFGFTAAEYARKQAEKEQQQRPAAIPGPIPDELIVPATESIGVKLLIKMGWRHGHSIKDSRANSLYDARREARKALLAFSSSDRRAEHADAELGENELDSFVEQPTNDVQSSHSTPVYVLNPKQDLYGLGYDPYKHAPEFRGKKRSRAPGKRKALSIKESLFGLKSGKAAPGFGIGALEEYDPEDEDVYSTAYEAEDSYVEEVEEPPRSITDHKPKLLWKDQGVLPGFKIASNSDYQLERFDPPAIPKDFVAHHKFDSPLDADSKHVVPPPPEVSPPEDNNLKLLIDGVATLVARSGKLFEDLSREKNQSNPSFSFLNGGTGSDYYARKLWEEQQKQSGQKRLALDGKSSPSIQKMDAESRGKILGEKPLERSARDLSSSFPRADVNLQFNLSDTFTKPGSYNDLPEVTKPFKDDTAKQERFEQYMKEKYQGGLRSIGSTVTKNMSEAARARERLDFEAAAEAIEKGRLGKESTTFTQQMLELSTTGAMQFTSGGVEQVKDSLVEDLVTTKIYPKREEFQWRPSGILCKRFDLIDPYAGKPPPPPRTKTKMDSLIFTLDSVKATRVEQTLGGSRDHLSGFQSDVQETSKGAGGREPEVEVEVENLERPVDLYKAIFSDDSDDEVEDSSLNKAEDPQKKSEVAETTLNRLMAGDFLESLGKELGLEVPPDLLLSSAAKSVASASQKETAIADVGGASILPIENKTFSTPNSQSVVSTKAGVLQKESAGGAESQSHKVSLEKIAEEDKEARLHSSRRKRWNSSSSSDDERSTKKRSRRHRHRSSNTDSDASGDHRERITEKDKKPRLFSSRQKKWNSSSSSDDERYRKRSRRRRHRSSDSDGDVSSDHQDQYHSKSKGRMTESSQVKRRHRRRSERHENRARDSPSRSHGTKKELAEDRRDKRKRRD